jgi:hypothetical protein
MVKDYLERGERRRINEEIGRGECLRVEGLRLLIFEPPHRRSSLSTRGPPQDYDRNFVPKPDLTR